MQNKPTHSDIILIAQDCVNSVYQTMGQNLGITQKEADDREYTAKLFKEYGKGVLFLSAVLTEKGIAALGEYDADLAHRMFQDAISIDSPENPYWYQYYYLALMQLSPIFTCYNEALGKETLKKLSQKYPSWASDAEYLKSRTFSRNPDAAYEALSNCILQ